MVSAIASVHASWFRNIAPRQGMTVRLMCEVTTGLRILGSRVRKAMALVGWGHWLGAAQQLQFQSQGRSRTSSHHNLQEKEQNRTGETKNSLC